MEKYAQQEGQQRNWPVSMGTTVDTQEAVPVYYGPPPKPYAVLGHLAAKSAGNTLRDLAKSAKSKGADAIIFWDSKVVNQGYATVSNGFAWGNYYNGYASAKRSLQPLVAKAFSREMVLVYKELNSF